MKPTDCPKCRKQRELWTSIRDVSAVTVVVLVVFCSGFSTGYQHHACPDATELADTKRLLAETARDFNKMVVERDDVARKLAECESDCLLRRSGLTTNGWQYFFPVQSAVTNFPAGWTNQWRVIPMPDATRPR